MTTMNEAWLAAVHEVHGAPEREVAPRGQRTREVLCHRLAMDLRYPVLTVRERRLGYRFLAAEAAWILSGRDDVAGLAPYSREVARFSDDGASFFGAYGPKVVAQLPYVLAKLREDPDTRQAVLNVWREAPPATRDVPCTLSCQFLVREGRLHLVVTMRSSDLWLGAPYDAFSFAMLAGVVVLALPELRLELGTLHQVAASRHLYERDWDRAARCTANSSVRTYRAFDLREFDDPFDLISHLWALAGRRANVVGDRFLSEALTWSKGT